MTWHAQLALVLGLVCLASAKCTGMSDDCSSNPIPLRQFNPLNFHATTCNLKWNNGCTRNKNGQLQQKPPPFLLCNSGQFPSGLIPVDAYTLAMQTRDAGSPQNSAKYTLHGLWPSSAGGNGARDQALRVPQRGGVR
ncbi:hypothetical protein NW765_007014 [Fusarium oxysporum]|nr:hypothetical protein NW765_007014 [Fusarium oxysporum]